MTYLSTTLDTLCCDVEFAEDVAGCGIALNIQSPNLPEFITQVDCSVPTQTVHSPGWFYSSCGFGPHNPAIHLSCVECGRPYTG
ncbi:hypothetical protein DFP73DRAFT_636539 [Morchella snyderi]|nr:hypothetical protein DFP73DRAFT_636539 [Morchella snyderi]